LAFVTEILNGFCNLNFVLTCFRYVHTSDRENTSEPQLIKKNQTRIKQMVRNSLKYVSWKNDKIVNNGLITVYKAPTDDSVQKVIYLAISDASKKLNMPIHNRLLAMNRFIIEFGDRRSGHL